MNSSRIILAAALLALAAAVRAEDAKPAAPADAKAEAPKDVKGPEDAKPNAKKEDHKDSCPDLTGKFACPAAEQYKQKAMSITVKSDAAAKTFEFSYDDGSKPFKVTANGKRVQTGKEWSSYVCRDEALIQIAFKDSKTKTPNGGSKQRLDKDGAYEVTGPDGKINLLCPRAKQP